MPHVNLEYSSNIPEADIDFNQLLGKLHANLAANDFCSLEMIKSRIIKHDNYYIADGKKENVFVAVNVAILSGRDMNILQDKAKLLLALLQDSFPQTFKFNNKAISVEFREINKQLYFFG